MVRVVCVCVTYRRKQLIRCSVRVLLLLKSDLLTLTAYSWKTVTPRTTVTRDTNRKSHLSSLLVPSASDNLKCLKSCFGSCWFRLILSRSNYKHISTNKYKQKPTKSQSYPDFVLFREFGGVIRSKTLRMIGLLALITAQQLLSTTTNTVQSFKKITDANKCLLQS